jgi:hypothetical protein
LLCIANRLDRIFARQEQIEVHVAIGRLWQWQRYAHCVFVFDTCVVALAALEYGFYIGREEVIDETCGTGLRWLKYA